MWLTKLSITRPMVVLTVIGALLAMGLLAWTRMGVDLLPQMDVPIVTVTTVYPGAGPEAVDTLVTKKVEDAVAALSEIDTIRSTSLEGVSVVTITFTEKASKSSPQDVERRVNAIRSDLPAEVKAPTIDKFDINAQPILQLSVSGDRDLAQLQQIGENAIQKPIEGISGVARVTLTGGLQREIQVLPDQQKLQARGLSILQVNQALGADNLNVPTGKVTDRGQDWNVRLNTQAQTLAELENVVVARTPSGVTHLRDVATVADTFKEVSSIQRTNGRSSVGVAIVKQASANTVKTADAVKHELEQIRRQLPPGVRVDVVQDASIYINQSTAAVQDELGLAILLTGLVLLLFLHTFRSTAIVLLAIPTSLISTIGVMALLGLSFNFMSLMGLTLTVGILVDDSIVVLENIFRHLQKGEAPAEAALNGRSEIGLAAIAITLVDVVVYTPIALMTGMTGAYFREFGLVVATATLFSLFISFTLTPLLASRWFPRGYLHDSATAKSSRSPVALFTRGWDALYGRLERGYRALLGMALRFRWLAVGLAVLSLAGGVSLVAFGLVSTEFMPQDDSGWMQVSIEMPAGTTLAGTDATTAKVEERLLALPETDKVFTTVGTGNGNGAPGQARYANIFVVLKDKQHRARSSQQVSEQARTFGQGLPDVTVTAGPLSTLGGTPPSGAVQVTIRGEDQAILNSLATKVADVVRKVPGTVNVKDGGVSGQPELVVHVDRERAADLGLTSAQVAGVLRTGLSGSIVGTYRPESSKGWDVNVLLAQSARSRVEQVLEIPLVTPSGESVRLSQVASVTSVSGPTQVTREDRQRSVTVTAGVNGRPSGDVAQDIQAGLDKIKVPLGYQISQGGAAKDQNESFAQIFQALALSVLLMYLLMVLLFESLLYPLIIMLSLPLALAGAFGLLALTDNTLNIMSMIGMILLTGLVGKNAILLVDYTNHLRRQGMERREALLTAGPTRLRPILMTTLALILAMLPLALHLGEGSEWRAPLAVTVIGGLLTSTLLTLVVIPAVYTLMDDVQAFLKVAPVQLRSALVFAPARTAPAMARLACAVSTVLRSLPG